MGLMGQFAPPGGGTQFPTRPGVPAVPGYEDSQWSLTDFNRWFSSYQEAHPTPLQETQRQLQSIMSEMHRVQQQIDSIGRRPDDPQDGPAWDTRQHNLDTQFEGLGRAYDAAVTRVAKAQPDALTSLTGAPIFIDNPTTGVREFSHQYVDPLDPKKTIADPHPSETALGNWANAAANRRATAYEGDQNRQNRLALSQQQTARTDATTKAQLAVAAVQDAISKRREAIDLARAGVAEDTNKVNWAKQITDQAIAHEKAATDMLTSAVKNLTDVGVAELASWDGLQKVDQSTRDATNTAIQNWNHDRSVEDQASNKNALDAYNNRSDNVTKLAGFAKDIYLESIKNTLYAPQGWWDSYQKGMQAIHAGRGLDPSWALIPQKAQADPQFVQKTAASLMGGYGATLDNPLGNAPTPVTPRTPIYGPGGSAEHPYVPFQADTATRPDLSGITDLAGGMAALGGHMATNPLPIPDYIPGAQYLSTPSNLGSGAAPSFAPPPGITDNPMDSVQNDLLTDTAPPPALGGSPDLSIPPEDTISAPDFGGPSPANYDAGNTESFRPPQQDIGPHIEAFVYPIYQQAPPEVQQDIAVRAGVDIAGILAGYDVKDVLNTDWQDTGYQYDLTDYDQQLQALMSGGGGDFYGA